MCENKEQQGNDTDKIETMKDKLELQLHEQYAINNNANVSSFIAMIGALIIAFTGYGYVLYQYLMGDVCCCKMADAETMIHIATFAVLVVIFILYMVAIEVGAGQRSNQFVIHAIRMKAYNPKEYKGIFPKGYHPFDKGICEFTQGIYNALSKIFIVLYVIIFVATSIRFIGWMSIIYLLGLLAMLWYQYKKYQKYATTNAEFKNRLELLNKDSAKEYTFKDYFEDKELENFRCKCPLSKICCAVDGEDKHKQVSDVTNSVDNTQSDK